MKLQNENTGVFVSKKKKNKIFERRQDSEISVRRLIQKIKKKRKKFSNKSTVMIFGCH